MTEELKLLELLEEENPIHWRVDFWKMTDSVHQRLQVIVDGWKANNCCEKLVELPEGFKEEMIDQIRYYDMHKMKIDGTFPTEWALKRIENNGVL